MAKQTKSKIKMVPFSKIGKGKFFRRVKGGALMQRGMGELKDGANAVTGKYIGQWQDRYCPISNELTPDTLVIPVKVKIIVEEN